MVSFTLFLLAASGLLLSKKLLDDFFSPPAVYNFFWCFALGCLELGWIDYEPLRAGGWQVIWLGYAGFMGGCLVLTAYGMGKKGWRNAQPAFQHLDRKKLERVLIVMFALGIFGFVVQLAHLQFSIGLGSFISDPMRAREDHTNIKYLGFFNILNVSNFVLALMYLVLYQRPRKWVVLIMLWALATTFVTTDRTRFFYMVIWAFYVGAYLFRRLDLSPRLIFAAGATFLALFGFFLLIAKIYKKEAFSDNAEYVNVGEELAPLVDPYIYLTGSFPVLQAFLDDHHEHTHGRRSFEPYVKVIEVVYPEFERAEIVGKFYRVPIELNACTYLEPYYKDWGIAGILIGSLVSGLIAMTAYFVMRQRKTLFSVYLSSLLTFCVTISIFVNHFVATATLYFVIVGYIVYRLTHTKEPQPISDFRPKIFNI